MAAFIGQQAQSFLQNAKHYMDAETGSAKITRGYKLPCKYVIHAVGPRWQGGKYHERNFWNSAIAHHWNLQENTSANLLRFH